MKLMNNKIEGLLKIIWCGLWMYNRPVERVDGEYKGRKEGRKVGTVIEDLASI